MPKPDAIYDFVPRPAPASRQFTSVLTQPNTVGVLGAGAAVALSPGVVNSVSLGLISPELAERIPGKVLAAAVGFALGWGATKSLEWIRWELFKKLIANHFWIRNPKSSRTKLWGLIVGLLRGTPPFSTLHFQSYVPRQPLPDLDASLDKWLKVSELIVSPEEFEYTKQAVEEFRVNEGPKLQAYLRKRAEEKTNWLSDYWISVAYLSGRMPVAIHSSFYFTNSLPKTMVSDPLAKAATSLYGMLSFSELVFSNKLQPVMLRKLVPLCMYNYKFIYNVTRIPGEHMDTVACHHGEKHIVVMRKGHFYKVDMYPPGLDGKPRKLTREEIYNMLQCIQNEADAAGLVPEQEHVAVLTAQRREVWKKHRDMLKVKNSDVLHAVESAMFVLVLDDHDTTDSDEMALLCLAGSGYDRWFDKSFNAVTFETCLQACVVEHSILDATVMAAFAEYCLITEQYDNGKVMADPDHPPRENLSITKKLNWDVSDMSNVILDASKEFHQLRSNVDVVTMQAPYGKGYMKTRKVSPDGYIQMVLQLAYYRLHHEVTKTYEPATNRMFALGRTETVHPISKYSKEWVQCMDDPNTPKDKKISLFKSAIKEQTQFRLEATMGYGCDRHLLGLFCASRELGMDVPKLFMDKSWQLSYKLSTSQTPNQLVEYGVELSMKDCCGGFGAVCEEGYGICYVILGDDNLTMHVTSWKSCESTSAGRMVQSLKQSFEDVKEMLA